MDNESPITSLCIVADPSRCPPNYELILKSYDRKEDCDIWRESGFLRASKITRYLCFSRNPQCSYEADEVLIDITIQMEKDFVPAGFRSIEKTNDSYDRAMRKKQISVKYGKLGSSSEAICDLVILTKSRRLPPLYTLIGDLNGVLLGCKMCKTEQIYNTPNPSYSLIGDNSSPTHSNNSFNLSSNSDWILGNGIYSNSAPPSYSKINLYQNVNNHNENGVRQFDTLNLGLNDIPFQLHSKYAESQMLNKFSNPISHIKTLLDIENEYFYSFHLETAVLQESPS